jgi:hypothetical protein
MSLGLLLIVFTLAFPFLFPEDFIYWSQKIRRWIREDLRESMREEEWREYEEEVPDY